MASRILVVDDEAHIRELCRLYLEQHGFEVDEAASGEECLGRALGGLPHSVHGAESGATPDLVVLDLGLPGMGGLEAAKVLVAHGIPLVMLTARDGEVDRVLGLELGADDYITKPFSPRELVARVKAVLRRSGRPAVRTPDSAGTTVAGGALAAEGTPQALTFEDFVIRPLSRILEVRGKPVDCPPKEFDLILTLARHPLQVFTRARLLELVWGYEYFGDDRTVDVHVQRIRKKVEPEPANPRYIVTVRGVGYRFHPDGAAR